MSREWSVGSAYSGSAEDSMSSDKDRREADIAWKAKMEVYQEQQVEGIAELKGMLKSQNGRIGRLELWRSGCVATGGAVLAWLGLSKG